MILNTLPAEDGSDIVGASLSSEKVRFRHEFGCSGAGAAIPLCPADSHIDWFGFGESGVDISASIAHCAVELFAVTAAIVFRRCCSTRR
jgi:hypothetical protein